MPENLLPYYDAVVAISQETLNRGFQKLFITGAFDQSIDIIVDEEYGKSLIGRMGVPVISFLQKQQSLIKITVPFKDDSFYKETNYNLKTKQLEETKTPVKSIGFVVQLNRIKKTDFKDADFTIESIYLMLTKLENIDVENFGPKLTKLGEPEKLFQALMEWIKGRTYIGKNGKEIDSLFIGEVKVPKTLETVGPMRVTSAAFSSTVLGEQQNEKAETGELNFLLMMKNRQLPKDSRAGLFDQYWGQPGEREAPDAVLVLSDYVILENYAVPVVQKAYPGIKFSLKRASSDSRAKLTQTEDCKMEHNGDEYTIKGLNAFINEQGKIQVDLTCVREERLQVDPGGPFKNIDFALFAVELKKPLSFYLKLKQDDKGNITCTFEEDQAKKNKDPEKEIKWNGDVDKPEDVIKWILSFVAIPYGIAMVVAQSAAIAIASAIKVYVIDPDTLNQSIEKASVDLNLSVELPGNPVFRYENLRVNGFVALMDAYYIKFPSLVESKVDPYNIPLYPKVNDNQKDQLSQTEPVLIGEAILSFRFVQDPSYEGLSRIKMPYYILRREQYWQRIHFKKYDGKAAVEETVEITLIKAEKNVESMENITNIKLTSKGTLKFFDVFSPELSSEISHNLKTTASSEKSENSTTKITRKISLPSSPKPYTIAGWIAVDRYTILRSDTERSFVGEWCYQNPNYWQIDSSDDHN